MKMLDSVDSLHGNTPALGTGTGLSNTIGMVFRLSSWMMDSAFCMTNVYQSSVCYLPKSLLSYFNTIMSFTPGPGFIDTGGTSDDSEIVTRTFKINRFDPHPRQKMLIIHGDLLVTVTNSLCQMLLAEKIAES
jgi:hypothetical protein